MVSVVQNPFLSTLWLVGSTGRVVEDNELTLSAGTLFPCVSYLLMGGTMYCNYCGKQIQDDANVCAYCGRRIGLVAGRQLMRPPKNSPTGRLRACAGFAQY